MERIRTRSSIFSSALARFALLIAFALLLGVPADAQSTASLSGTVTDPTGAAVPNAKVVASNQATGVESTTQTGGSGAYLFSSLPIGSYRIEVTVPGFQKGAISGIRLDVATSVSQDVQLKVGEVTQEVEITADSAQVETTSTGLGQVLNDKTVQEIPLNGRHFTDLSLLTPGTVTPPQNGFLSAPLRGQGSFGINTGGSREDTTNWLVNGVNLNDNAQNQLTFQPPIDTLAEFKIDNSSYPAQYGRNSGAIVNLATRSGTNDYHGEAFEFFRNNDLDARNFFNPITQPQATFKRNDFGADFGGPIKQNKVFFFAAYEGLRQRQGLTVSSTVPTAVQRAAVTSPAVNALLSLVPLPNVGASTFSGPASAQVGLNQGSGDIDIEINDRNRLHGYYVIQKDLRQEPTQGANLPGFGDTRNGFRQLMTISEDHTFSPALTNTVRLGFNRIHLFFTPPLRNDADFGIPLPAGVPAGALSAISVSGAMAFGGPAGEPQGRGDTTVVLNDGLSWLKGHHSFQFGGEIRRAYNNNVAENIGTFTFANLNAFLTDTVSTFSTQIGSGNDKVNLPAYALYAQDSFKWKPNFTFNLGLRYEWNSSPFEARSRFTNFDPTTGTLIPASQPYHTNNKNFEPRIGFAWDPFKDGKTSVRAAYAIVTQAPTANIVTGLSGNPPFAIPVSIGSGVITLENPIVAAAPTSLGPAAINPNFNNSYSQDWNLTIERQLSSSMSFSVAYVGLKATHLQLNENINEPLVVNGLYSFTRPFTTLPLTSPILPAQCAAPNPPCTFGGFNQINSVGNSNYNALWATLNKHLSHGFEFLASYTYSKSLDYNSLSTGESIVLQDPGNPHADYGRSEFDARHRFVLSGFYTLPFKGNRLVSGWQAGIITQAQTGNPLNPTLSASEGPNKIAVTLRPDLIGPIATTGDPQQFFAGGASSFATPCAGAGTAASPLICHPGTLGRDAITGPNFLNTDFSVTKNTKINERVNLQFRTEFFDIFNHPNFGNPVLTTTSASFGQILSTRFPAGDFGSAREVQFALKLQF